MLRLLIFSWIVALCVVIHAASSDAQERNIAPYLGASGSAGPEGIGWGIEAGLRILPFYAGLEYGGYSPLSTVQTSDPIPGHIPDPYILSGQFWGIHVGYFWSRFLLYLGIAVLESPQRWEVPSSDSTFLITTRNYLDFGPDFRYSGLADGHLYLAFAFTIRRGFKAGLGYMF